MNPNYEIRENAATSLLENNWNPTNKKEELALLFAQRKWYEIIEFGKDALDIAVRALNDDHP